MIHAATIGIARSAHAITKGWLHKHGFEGLGFNESIAGAIGEYVAATILDLEWKPKIGDPSPGDIGDNTEVRTTVRKPKDKSARRLLIHDDDPNDVYFVLVRIDPKTLPTVDVAGWYIGRNAKKKEYRKNHGDDNYKYFFHSSAFMNFLTISIFHRVGAARTVGLCQSGFLK